MYLFFISIPFVIWVQLHKIIVLNNDVVSMIFFSSFLLAYFALVGHLISHLKLNFISLNYWIFFISLFFLNILAYKKSLYILNSLTEAIKKIF